MPSPNIPYTIEETVPTTSQEGLLSSLGINGTLFTFQIINFVVVMLVLWYLILKPLTKKMAERQKMIGDSVDNVKKIEANLGMSERKYQEKIDQAKVDANKILEKASLESLQMAEAMREKAKKDIEQLVDQARKNIKTERDESITELKAQAADLIISAAEKILASKIDIEKDNKIITEAVKSLE
ncbi:MAG TPA: F0F1 ATP synthase subunit B [Candidatus Udaeobacter sp.]|nr:F0F1 ATP synthase subunit B [Candidatus Udaeobacter sp.]